jgi:L-threonylcarbamoyladenylate synthase
MTRCLVVDPRCPDVAALDEAVAVLRRGGVIAYPTDTVYGLAVDALQPEAIGRLYALKGRPAVKALPVIIGELAQLASVVAAIPANAERLMAAFWPGPLTLLMTPQARIPALLLGDSDRIGVRWPASAISQQLAQGLGGAITASSANLSGVPAALTAAEVAAQLAPALDLILDGGAMTNPEVSTILDVTVAPPCLYRAGRISHHTIEAILGCRIPWCAASPSATAPLP